MTLKTEREIALSYREDMRQRIRITKDVRVVQKPTTKKPAMPSARRSRWAAKGNGDGRW
jgi:hypothetical protein